MNIRLIAADMDGTLLDSRKQLPEGLFPLVRTLHERGVRFAPASGRQFYTLYEQFGEIADELMYISENGAMICDEQAQDVATDIWRRINEPNLEQNVRPTRGRARLILSKDHDHKIRRVLLRKN